VRAKFRGVLRSSCQLIEAAEWGKTLVDVLSLEDEFGVKKWKQNP